MFYYNGIVVNYVKVAEKGMCMSVAVQMWLKKEYVPNSEWRTTEFKYHMAFLDITGKAHGFSNTANSK